MVSEHIGVEEACAFLESFQLYCKTQPIEIKGSVVVVDVDSMTVFHAFKIAKSRRMHIFTI